MLVDRGSLAWAGRVRGRVELEDQRIYEAKAPNRPGRAGSPLAWRATPPARRPGAPGREQHPAGDRARGPTSTGQASPAAMICRGHRHPAALPCRKTPGVPAGSRRIRWSASLDFGTGFLGHRVARAAASRLLRRSISSGENFLGTPFASRPRACAARFKQPSIPIHRLRAGTRGGRRGSQPARFCSQADPTHYLQGSTYGLRAD